MGITGLLPFVKVASSEKHLSHFQGQTAAIDSYCWLHKGAFGCAEKIAKGETTTAYVQYCFKFISMLQTFHIKPIMVFDGRHLPAKKLTEVKRRENRQQAKKRAIEALSLGKDREARSNFQRCIDITPEMAFELIKECRKRHIDCIVAPYEADPQLAFLNREKIADFIISEDSDLLTFGCNRVLFKLNLAGNGVLVEANKLHMAMEERADEYTLTRFRHMCILSGCDYIDSLPGVGLRKALKFLKSYPKTPIQDAIPRLPAFLKMRKVIVTKEYIENFLIAEATFQHQIIFNPVTKVLEPLFDTGLMNTNPRFCCNAGLNFGNVLGYQMAIGNLNPLTMEKIDNWFPTNTNVSLSSIWKKPTTTTSAITATITSYFQSQPSTSFHRPLILSKTPKKRKKVTISPIPLPEPQNHTGLSDEILLKMYSSAGKSPPSKRVRTDQSDNEEELSSPIISRRKDAINPFVRNANTSRKMLFTDDPSTSQQSDSEISGTGNQYMSKVKNDESNDSSSSMENEFETSYDTFIESSDEGSHKNRDAPTIDTNNDSTSTQKKPTYKEQTSQDSPPDLIAFQTENQLAVLPSIFSASSSQPNGTSTTSILSVGSEPNSQNVLAPQKPVAQMNQVTKPPVHCSTSSLSLLKSSRAPHTVPDVVKLTRTQVSLLKAKENATSRYFSAAKTISTTKNQPSTKLAQNANLMVYKGVSSKAHADGENLLPESNILILKRSSDVSKITTTCLPHDRSITGAGTSRFPNLDQFARSKTNITSVNTTTSKTMSNVSNRSLLIKIPKNKTVDANASTSKSATNVNTLVCNKKIEILKVVEIRKVALKTLKINDTDETQNQKESVNSDEDKIVDQISTTSNNDSKIEPLQESSMNIAPKNIIHRRYPEGGTQPGSIWDLGAQILDICKTNLAKMRKKSTETTEEQTDESPEITAAEHVATNEIIENVGVHTTDDSSNVRSTQTITQNERPLQIVESIEISDDSSDGDTNKLTQAFEFMSRAQNGNNKSKEYPKKNGKQTKKVSTNQSKLSQFGFKKM